MMFELLLDYNPPDIASAIAILLPIEADVDTDVPLREFLDLILVTNIKRLITVVLYKGENLRHNNRPAYWVYILFYMKMYTMMN